jgi:hypothetical protein
MGDSRAQGVQSRDDVMTVSKAALCEAFVEAFRLRILDYYDGPFHGGELPERHARQAVLDGLDRLSRMSNEVMADHRLESTIDPCAPQTEESEMSDAPEIEPVLSPEEWAYQLRTDEPLSLRIERAASEIIPLDASQHFGAVQLIALANASLADGDPRKITYAMVDEIYEEAREYDYRGLTPDPGEILDRIADALASYLPPETE